MHSFIFQNLFITNLYFSTHSLYISTQVDENTWQNASLSSNKNFCFPPLTPRSNENPNNSRSSSGNSNNNTCVVHIRLNRNRVHDVLLPFQNWSALTTTRLLQLLTQILARQTVPISAMPISTAVLWHSSNLWPSKLYFSQSIHRHSKNFQAIIARLWMSKAQAENELNFNHFIR